MSDTPETIELENNEGQQSSDESSKKGGSLFERCFFMLFFGVAGYFVFWLIILLAVVQLVLTLVQKQPNEDLRRFMVNLATYMKQIGLFLGFATDEKPCPFAPFPDEAGVRDEAKEGEAEPAI